MTKEHAPKPLVHGTASQGAAAPPSLRLILLRPISIVLLVTLLFGGVLTYWQAHFKIETEVRSALGIAEKTVQKVIPEIERVENPRRELVRLIRLLDGNRHVKATLVEPGPGGRRIESEPAQAGNLPNWFFALLALEPEIARIELPETLRGFGHLELATESSAEVAEVWNEVILKLAILMLFCAALLGLVYATLGRALEPVTSVSEAFERLGSGDYRTRVPVRGPAELSKLCAGFNDMAERLGRMERQNQQLNDQLAMVQEEERADLARDLHDEVSPYLFSVEVDAAQIRQYADAATAPTIAARADAIRDAAAHMMKHVRSILGRLRTGPQMELGLEHAIEALASSWRVRNPAVTIHTLVEDTGFDQHLDNVIHGIVREALNNALKHGHPTEIDVSVTRRENGDVITRIRDNGRGLRPDWSSGDGFGLVAMRERVSALRGTFAIENRTDGAGVEVAVCLPAKKGTTLTELRNQVEA